MCEKFLSDGTQGSFVLMNCQIEHMRDDIKRDLGADNDYAPRVKCWCSHGGHIVLEARDGHYIRCPYDLAGLSFIDRIGTFALEREENEKLRDCRNCNIKPFTRPSPALPAQEANVIMTAC